MGGSSVIDSRLHRRRRGSHDEGAEDDRECGPRGSPSAGRGLATRASVSTTAHVFLILFAVLLTCDILPRIVDYAAATPVTRTSSRLPRAENASARTDDPQRRKGSNTRTYPIRPHAFDSTPQNASNFSASELFVRSRSRSQSNPDASNTVVWVSWSGLSVPVETDPNKQPDQSRCTSSVVYNVVPMRRQCSMDVMQTCGFFGGNPCIDTKNDWRECVEWCGQTSGCRYISMDDSTGQCELRADRYWPGSNCDQTQPGNMGAKKSGDKTKCTGCEVSNWVAWAACSVTCGQGTTARTRTIQSGPFAGDVCPILDESGTCTGNTTYCRKQCCRDENK
eukprot:GHVU01061640.1.p1 GENE.GHVU01061640.1~~GHVU01061640.1.p1  ORF type:complete len:336 (+),score=3.95 GHVU01061640.1:347-1354(+)